MNLIDVSVPLDANLPTYPRNTPFGIEAVLLVVGSDGAPARVVLRQS